jgi:DNA polymerase III subunit epsilon
VNPPINWAAFDLETHALENPRIIEIGAAYFRGNSHHTTENLRCNPGCPITPGATAIHGITDDAVSSAPVFAQRAAQLAIDLAQDGGNTIVTYNGRRFDIPATVQHFKECGIDWQPRTLDLFDFVNWKLRHLKNRKLEDMCQRFGVGLANAHRAADDAEAAGNLLLTMQMEGLIPEDIEEAIEVGKIYAEKLDKEWQRFKWYIYVREDGVPMCGYSEKNIGQPLAKLPGFLRWALNLNEQESDPDKKMPTEVVELFKRPRTCVEPL